MKFIIYILLINITLVSYIFAENENTYFTQAETYFKLEDYKKAITNFNKALEMESNNNIKSQSLLYLGKCYYYLNNKMKSIESFQKVINNYPDSPYAKQAQFKIKLANNRNIDK